MVTTIQISSDLKDKLEKRKIGPKDTFEDVIWDMYEDTLELSEDTKKIIDTARKQFADGNSVPFAEVMKKAGL